VAHEKLTRPEQRFNYGIAIGAVILVVILVIASPHVQFDGLDVPILVVALLAGAFLFGLGQMVIGITRRRRYLRSMDAGDEPPRPP
jgi:uncharacterized membrane protein